MVAVEAVSRAAILSEWTGARIHILHISSAEELRPLREAKARGVDITGETCPHYVLLSTDDYASFAGVIRVNPPVREKRNQEPLWAALTDGTIDVDRDRPRAAFARGEDPQRHLDRRLRLSGRRDADAADADRGRCGPLQCLRLRALERCQSSQDLGPLSAQGRDPARRRCRHRNRRSRARMDDRRRQVAVVVQDHTVSRPQGPGLAGAHAGARPVCHEGPDAGVRDARLGPVGARYPEFTAATAAERRSNDDSHRPRRISREHAA